MAWQSKLNISTIEIITFHFFVLYNQKKKKKRKKKERKNERMKERKKERKKKISF